MAAGGQQFLDKSTEFIQLPIFWDVGSASNGIIRVIKLKIKWALSQSSDGINQATKSVAEPHTGMDQQS